MVGVLDGVRVVELAQNAAIPHCGRLLAGLGADVIKVEPPEGDAMRGLADLGPAEGKAFALFNPGKRGLALDLGAEGAAEVVRALFTWADVALVAFKPADLARYGIDWDSARTVNPRLVHLTHTALGPEGPDADSPGYDVLVQGRSGTGFVMNRSVDGVPLPTRPAVHDFATGMLSAFAVVSALRHRDATGEGQRVDTSLLGTALSLGTAVLGSVAAVDDEPVAELNDDLEALRAAGVDFDTQRAMYEDRVLSGQGAFKLYFRHYRTADGIISIGALSPGLFRIFHEVTGLPVPDRADHTTDEFSAVVEAAEALFLTRSSAEWLATLRTAGYPCGPYLTPPEAMADKQARANDYIIDLEHPVFGQYTTTGIPIRFSGAKAGVTGPSPTLGQHSVEVLAELGLDSAAIETLTADGVIATGPPAPAD